MDILVQASQSIIIPFQLDALKNPLDNPFSIEQSSLAFVAEI